MTHQRHYMTAYRTEIVKLMLKQHLTVKQAAKLFGIPDIVLQGWMATAHRLAARQRYVISSLASVDQPAGI